MNQSTTKTNQPKKQLLIRETLHNKIHEPANKLTKVLRQLVDYLKQELIQTKTKLKVVFKPTKKLPYTETDLSRPK